MGKAQSQEKYIGSWRSQNHHRGVLNQGKPSQEKRHLISVLEAGQKERIVQVEAQHSESR